MQLYDLARNLPEERSSPTMDELLLEHLCRICNIHTAKYTCPRCYFPTCSLPCARRHKTRASCTGERDQTAFKPMSLLATPSGIDHDYNFLHSIEHRVQRSEQLIVEVKGLVDEEELKLARAGEEDRAKHRRKTGAQKKGEEPIQRSLKNTQTTVQRAPRGMIRNLENETTWSRSHKCINWQVEWLREGDAGRVLAKLNGNMPIGEQYAEIMRLESKTGGEGKPTGEQKVGEKRKRPSLNAKGRAAKQRKLDMQNGLPSSYVRTVNAALQDQTSTAWSVMPESHIPQENVPAIAPKLALPTSVRLFLLRPQTPSNLPKVLVPIDPSSTLETLLRQRTVLEFPTIYVFVEEVNDTPNGFMLEEDFLTATGQDHTSRTPKAIEEAGADENASNSSQESDTSDSGSDSEESLEEEEVVPKIWRTTR